MKGFDPEFRDPADYILKITERIWEGRDLDAIRRHYAPDCVVRTPAGVTTDVEAVVVGTADTMRVFPDRELLGEDVIWSGDGERGFLSSHRIVSPMTHLGDGVFGPATGRKVLARTIADCAVRDGVIYEEWLVRDYGAILRQLGESPREAAFRAVAAERAAGRTPSAFSPDRDVPGRYRPVERTIPEAEGWADMLRRVWIEKDLSAIGERYHDAATLRLPGGATGHGKAAADRFWLSYVAALPDADFSVDHMIGRADPGRARRAAIRWSARGRHAGFGAFGPPTGADLHVMGIAHAEFLDGRIHREWVLADEFAIWKGIAVATG